MPKPAPVVMRMACTCRPVIARHTHRPCRACQQWEHGQVLLVDGTTVAKALWVAAQAPVEEVADGSA